MPIRQRQTCGFTLVEILIVVVILAILAAIVIPQFSNATTTTKANQLGIQLFRIRTQIEVYRNQHQGWPTLAQMWSVMTSRTDQSGTLNPAGQFGPYLMTAPINPFTQSQTIVAPGSGIAIDGWEYDETNGTLTGVGFNETTGQFTPP